MNKTAVEKEMLNYEATQFRKDNFPDHRGGGNELYLVRGHSEIADTYMRIPFIKAYEMCQARFWASSKHALRQRRSTCLLQVDFHFHRLAI